MKLQRSGLFVLYTVISVIALSGCFPDPAGMVCALNRGCFGSGAGVAERGHLSTNPKSAAASPGDRLFVSATAHVAGALGTNWRSDVEVHNLSDETAIFRISLLEHGADNSSPDHRDLSLAPGRSLRLGDVLAGEFGVEGQAALILEPSTGRIVVTSRTYNLLGEGNQLGLPTGSTFGQYIPALPLGEAIRSDEQGRLIQLSHRRATTGGFRTNLGLVNATGAELRVEIELYAASGDLLGNVSRTLAPYGYRQLNQVFANVTSGDVDDGYAIVRTTTSGGVFFAYASVVDNLTGDPVAISAARLPEAAPSTVGAPIYVVASAHVAGAAGTNWRSDVEVHCWSDEPAAYTVELLEHGANNSTPMSRSFTLQSGESARFVDILDTVFDFDGAAALRVMATSGRVLVTSRTYNLLGAGNELGLPAGATFGQFIPGMATNEAIGVGEEGRLIQLSHSADDAGGFRTNLVLVNATTRRIDVKIRLFTADGTPLGTIDRSLAPYEYRQLNRVFGMVTGDDVTDGYVVVNTTTAGGAFFALASVVDNLTGDPVGMGAPVILSPDSEAVLGGVERVYNVLGQSSLEDFVNRIQSLGTGGMLDVLVTTQPEVATRTANGMVMDYGDGWVAPDGTIVSGSITVDISGLSVSSSGINGTMTITHNQLLIDGEPPVVGSTAWTFDLTERADTTVAGEITVGPVGGTKSSGSLSGTIDIDTAICLEYPISGSLTAVVEGETITITFRPNCDGTVEREIAVSSSDSFSYGYGSPASPNARDHIASSSNAEVASEGTVWYWRPSVGAETIGETTPGVVTFHFPFTRQVASGRLLLQLATFHWSYSRGHAYLYGSTDGVDWQLLAEVEPPEFGEARGGGWNGDLPLLFIGATDIWLQTRLFSFGPNAASGGVYCNTVQMSRWDEAQTTNTFELEVELE